MNVRTLVALPASESETGCDFVQFVSDGVTLIVKYVYFYTGKHYVGAIKFKAVIAHRFASEPNTSAMIVAGYGPLTEEKKLALVRELLGKSGDSIAEIEDSPWVTQIIESAPDHTWPFRRRHFAMDLSNNGFFEIIADDYKLLPSREGTLPDLDDDQP